VSTLTHLASINSWFNGNQVLIENILIYMLLAFSVQVALRTGIFSLAGIGFYAVGSYTAGLLVKDEGWPAVLAIGAALVLSALVGYLLAVLLVRLRDLYLAMATFAFVLMVGVVALNWNAVTGGPLGVNLIPVSVSLLALILTTVVVVILLTLMEVGTLGRTLSMIREDEQLALSFAVDSRRYRRFAFVVSSMLGALAGAMHALIFNVIQPQDADFNLIVLALTMVIIGGFGSWTGAAIGAFLLTWIPMQLTSIGNWWPVYYGAAVVIVATLAPGGLIGLVRRAMRTGASMRARRLVLPAGSMPAGPSAVPPAPGESG
jgi:branched-chain amino acid transport system permease protein